MATLQQIYDTDAQHSPHSPSAQSITHELKLGTLKLTFTGEESNLSMSAGFELASSGELYSATFDDSAIRQLCPVFAQLPELAADALKTEPNITVTDAMATVTFEARVFTRTYAINLAIGRVRTNSSIAEVADLQRENISLRTRVRALEGRLAEIEKENATRDRQLIMLANVCLQSTIRASDYPGPQFEECLALSGRQKSDVLNEYITPGYASTVLINLNNDSYERLIADGFSVNLGIDEPSLNRIMMWIYSGHTPDDQPLRLKRFEFAVRNGFDSEARATCYKTSALGVVNMAKKITSRHQEQYNSLIELMISKGAK